MSVDVRLSKAAERYLEAVGNGLLDLDAEDREEILRDLETHLAELGRQDPVAALGGPDEFVSEFRLTAGLDDPPGRISRLVGTGRQAVERLSSHPMVAPFHRHRSELRTVWVWIRAWVVLNALWWTQAYWYGSSITFGVPWSDSDTIAGIVLVALATAASVWVDGHRRERRWGRADRLLTMAIVILALFAWLNPIWIEGPDSWSVEAELTYSNIYAYDREGAPVEVLLYDQDGRPLNVGVDGEVSFDGSVFYDWWGPVRYDTDRYGRPITNLYPLDRVTEEWDGPSAREPTFESVPPPPVAIPDFETSTAGAEETARDTRPR